MTDPTFLSGAEVASHLSGVSGEQVQPNGVDLTAEKLSVIEGKGRITKDGKDIAERSEVPPGENGQWWPMPDFSPYIVQYGETIRVPNDCIGFVLPRSSLMRNGCQLNTAVWDSGYEGKGEGLLVAHNSIYIEQGARIGQFVLARADSEGTYDGTYQGEGLGDDA